MTVVIALGLFLTSCQAIIGADEGQAIPPTCTDGILNNGESSVDCGGATGCSRCAEGSTCAGDGDCATGLCRSSSEGLGTVCVSATCDDGEKNGAETDVDCGGACAACGDGLGCADGSDCQSHVCTAGICVGPTCTDGVNNGDEAAIDCGGSCPLCGDGSPCGGDGDCASGVCTNNTCTPASCHDTVKNGTEVDVDCGGYCPPCPVAPSCSDGVQNQDEEDVDCGGVCDPCPIPAPTCSDGMKNAAETDVDCGGGGGVCAAGECLRCANGETCLTDSDCASWHCNNGVCSTRMVTMSVVDNNAVRAVALGTFAGSNTRIAAGGNTQPSVISLVSTALDATSGPVSAAAAIVPVSVKAASFSSVDNSFVVAGSYDTDNNEVIKCGSFTFPNVPSQRTAVFVAKISAANADYGTCLWLDTFGVSDSTNKDQATGVAIDNQGNIYVVGDAEYGSFDVGGVGQPINGVYDGFVIKLDKLGTVGWSRFFNGSSQAAEAHVTGIATIGNHVVVTGWLYDTATWMVPGSGVVTTLGVPAQARALLARIAPAGNLSWAFTYGPSTTKGVAVAVDAGGDILMAASTNTKSSFKSSVPGENPSSCTNAESAVPPKNAVAIAKYAGADGACLWANAFGGTNDEQPTAIAVDPLDPLRRVYVAGTFAASPFDVDGASCPNNSNFCLQNKGAADLFLMALDQGGTLTGVRSYGGPNADSANALAVLPCGQGLVLGGQMSTIDATPTLFDGIPFPPIGQSQAAFLANVGALP